MTYRRALIGFHCACEIGNRLDAAQGEDNANEGNPDMTPTSLKWSQVLKGEVGDTEGYDANNDNHSRQRQSHCKISAVAGAEQIDGSDYQNHPDRRHHDVVLRDAKVAHGRPSAECRCDGEVCHKQEGRHNREDFSMRSSGRVDAASFGEAAANDNVVQAHEEREHAHGYDDRKRGKADCRKGEAQDIRFAGPPVAIEQSRCPLPIQIAGALNRDVVQSGRSFQQRGGVVANQIWAPPRLCCLA